MMFVTSNDRRTIFEALLEARRIPGGRHVIAEDVERKPLSYDQLVTRAFILSDLLSRDSGPGDRVGVLLPGSVGNLVTVLALQLRGRVPAMLNVTAGADGVRAACAAADVRTVYTSREFVKAAQLDDAIRRLRERTTVIFLEDVRARITVLHTLSGWVRAHLAGRLPRGARGQGADDPAVVLFTAGTEGPPKGVVLSHANLLTNQTQVAATIDVSPRDLLLNALPLFHAFGLTTGTILPVLSGVKVFFYPSPLHYRIVPEVA